MIPRTTAAGWVLVVASACGGPPPEAPSGDPGGLSADPPAAPGAFAPSLTVDDAGVLLSWLESLPEGGHRFLVSRLADGVWAEPAEIARGGDFFANWADVPGLGVAGDGSLLAHWLVRTGEETYAYSIALARSTDGGTTWRRIGWLPDDSTPTEHGFVGWATEGEAARAVWLDGRAMADDGPMSLRTALVDADGAGASEVLDERVCECCATDLAATARGALAVYRDRSASEVRDIGLARPGRVPAGALRPDGWRIAGCPVNGPAIDADAERVAVAWFTAASERPAVRVAFSADAGETFSRPYAVDLGAPLGRVDVRLDPDGGAVVSWLESGEADAAVLLRRFAADGAAQEPIELGRTASSRSSGFPKLAPVDGDWLVVWVEADGDGVRGLRAVRSPRDGV